MDFDTVSLEQALEILGERFELEEKQFEVVAIGGASLLLLGQIDRTTKDLDLLAYFDRGQLIAADQISREFMEAVEEVGKALGLGKLWLNCGPSSLLALGLPDGFEGRLTAKQYGGLTLHCAGRFDQICFKLYASVDQGPSSKHFADLKRLQPTKKELLSARDWCVTQDVSLPFAKDIREALSELGVSSG